MIVQIILQWNSNNTHLAVIRWLYCCFHWQFCLQPVGRIDIISSNYISWKLIVCTCLWTAQCTHYFSQYFIWAILRFTTSQHYMCVVLNACGVQTFIFKSFQLNRLHLHEINIRWIENAWMHIVYCHVELPTKLF